MYKYLKVLGPGLLFASTAIGTSHLVLSTRAGAHHGFVFFWVILIALILKYPFYEYAPRYVAATGDSLISAYKKQGNWALSIFFFIICFSMFFVTGAIGAVTAGLISISFGLEIPQWIVYCSVMSFTALILIIGKYKVLEILIKIISVILLLSVSIIFVAILIKGPLQPNLNFEADSIFYGPGLALLISLIGWMPNGMEGSAMYSVWVLENSKVDKEETNLKNALFDFRFGYVIVALLAFMFLIIGIYASYGSGNKLDGNTVVFSKKLLSLFSNVLGSWSFPLIAIAALGAIYGTLLTVWDVMARCFILCISSFKSNKKDEHLISNPNSIKTSYTMMIIVIGLGGFLLFSFFKSQVLTMLEFATIGSFVSSPIIALLNWRAVNNEGIPANFRPSKAMNALSFIGILTLFGFAFYYLFSLL